MDASQIMTIICTVILVPLTNAIVIPRINEILSRKKEDEEYNGVKTYIKVIINILAMLVLVVLSILISVLISNFLFSTSDKVGNTEEKPLEQVDKIEYDSNIVNKQDSYICTLDQLKEYEFDKKTTYNFYYGYFTTEADAGRAAKMAQEEIENNDNIKKVFARYESQIDKYNYKVEVLPDYNGGFRVCILKGLHDTVREMKKFEVDLEKELIGTTFMLGYNEYLDDEIEKINDLIESMDYHVALNGLAQIIEVYKPFINGFNDYDDQIKSIILAENKLRELVSVNKELKEVFKQIMDVENL